MSRTRNDNGAFRRKRGDTKLETLKENYPEFRDMNGNKHLGTLKKELGVDSLDDVLKVLRDK